MLNSTVCIVIVNWNAGTRLQPCIDSIAATEWDSASLTSLVIVDNASTDRSLDTLRIPAGLPVDIIRNERNLGFAAACNQGAADVASDFILFLNPDTVLESSSVPTAVAWLAAAVHGSTGIVGIQLIDEDGVVSRSCARLPTTRTMLAKVLGLDRLLPIGSTYLMEDWDHRDSREVDHVIGAFYLVRTPLFRSLGGFDTAFFVYFEDLDFSARAKQAGWGSYYLTEARAFHKGGGTSDQIKSRRLFYSLQSRLIYARKHFPPLAATLVALATFAVEPGIRIAACAIGGSPTGLRETLAAYRLLWTASRGVS